MLIGSYVRVRNKVRINYTIGIGNYLVTVYGLRGYDVMDLTVAFVCFFNFSAERYAYNTYE